MPPPTRKDSRAAGGPIRAASSASRTWRALASASEYTATVATPSRPAVLMTRHAISPRFAIRIFLNMPTPQNSCAVRARVPAAAYRSWPRSHPEDAELRGGDRRVQCRGDGEAKHPAGLGRINDAVIPHPRRRVIRVALRLVLRADRRLEFLFFLRTPFAALQDHAVAPDGRQHAGRLLSSHDADARIGPHPEKARRIGPAAHAIIAGSEAAADQHGDLRNLGGRNRGHHLGAVLRDPPVLILSPDHEA